MLSMDDTSTSQWDDVMAANARGTFNLLKATLPHLRSRGYGRVVAVSSIAADFGYRYPAYSASKAAVVALARTAAVESAQYGVTVNVVSPGRIATPMAPQDSEAELARRVPIGRAATTDEVAAVVCSLLSPDMSYITGANIVCDGGMSCVFALHGLGPYSSGVSVTG
jgi:NAD(P)-dependent dehydrogenase (short-subunit alcohol dehydrogenase family)